MNPRITPRSKVGGDQEARRLPIGSRIIDPRTRTVWTKTAPAEWVDDAGHRIGVEEAMYMHRFREA